MYKKIKSPIAAIALIIAIFCLNTPAQDNVPAYILTFASKAVGQNGINIVFKNSFPKDGQTIPAGWVCPGSGNTSVCYLAGTGSIFAQKKWFVQAFDLTTGDAVEKSITEVQVYSGIQTVRLILADNIDTSNFKYVITYREANIPSITLGQPPKKNLEAVFTAAKGKADADIYFKGSATASQKNRPIYSIEAKLGYMQSLRSAGSIGGKFTWMSDEESNVDPDSITATASYQKLFLLGNSKGIKFNSDFLGAEFDRKNTTRNLMSGADATLILPSAQLGKMTFFTAEFIGGFDAGRNYKHPLNVNGLGNFWRPKVGINTYFLALNTPMFDRVSFNTEYKLRLPQSLEPFTRKINGADVTTLTRKPRHYLGADLNLLFTDAYGIAISYRYGSLPPVYKLMEHKVSIGFVVQFAQAKKDR